MRKLAIKLFYYLGVDAVFYWLNRKSKRVLTFHHVIPDKLLPESERDCICMAESEFKAILDEVGTKFGFSNDLRDSKTCAISFDDGYLNQYEVAGSVLKERGVPAMLFLAAKLENGGKPLAVDRHIVWARNVPMEIAEKFFGRKFESRDELWRLAVRPMFAEDGICRGEESMRKLNDLWSIDSACAAYDNEFLCLRFRGVTTEQIEELRSRGWVIGHHTYSHFPVCELSERAATDEITPPATLCDQPFSFPYGNLESISERDVDIARRAGYPVAFANGVEHCAVTGRYLYPRFMLYTTDRYDIHFQLSGLKYFLKYRRLLPKLI